jgi:hypothetical protein
MVYPTGTVIFNVSQIKNSQRTGSSPDDVHVPKLWYYDKLLFLEDQDFPRKSYSIESVLDNFPFEHDNEVRKNAIPYPCFVIISKLEIEKIIIMIIKNNN